VSRRGALLLELIASIAIFIVGGLAILAVLRQSTDAVVRAREGERASSLARSAMAAIEAGIVEPDMLSGPVLGWSDGWLLAETPGGWGEESGAFEDRVPTASEWTLEVRAEPSEFAGLEVVTVRAFRGSDPERGGGATYTLRQLVRTTGLGGAAGAGGRVP